MIWNGHELVSTGHPEDDDPWCKNCGLSADDPRAKAPCKRVSSANTASPLS